MLPKSLLMGLKHFELLITKIEYFGRPSFMGTAEIGGRAQFV
jgi:hypothetical protein